MKKLFLLVVIVLTFNACVETRREKTKDDNFAERTLSENRKQFKQDLIQKTIHETLQKELNDSTAPEWMEALWGIGFSGYRSAETRAALEHAFVHIDKRSFIFQRAFLETIYTVYQDSFVNEMEMFADKTKEPKLFAMAVNYLLLNNNNRAEYYLKMMDEKFPEWQQNPILFMLQLRLSSEFDSQITKRPPLADLLNHDFKGKPVVFSFQRHDRRFPGLAVIRKADGSFVKDSSGQIFAIKQLAMALSNMPGYITNGNTPQGILSMQGFAYSQNVFIGPSLTLQLVLPYEASPDTFFHQYSGVKTPWSSDLYKEILPLSWQEYMPIYEAFYAGKAGRTEIIAHGTTADPEFYAGATYYPFTPSLGCLTAYELWDDQSGRTQISHQKKLTKELQKEGDGHGYLVVVELDDQQKPVELWDVEKDIIATENEFNKKSM